MQTFYLFVVCLCIIHTATGTSSSSPPPPPPLACDSNGTLTYTGVPDWVHSASSNCSQGVVNVTTNAIVIKGCPMDTPVTVFMYNTSTAPDKNSRILKDRRDVMIFTCNTANGVYNATINFTGPGSVSPTTFTANEPISLSMSLTTQNSSTAAHTIEIGTPYDLHITGAGNHFMKLLNCKAAADNTMTDLVTVYNVTDPVHDPGVISPFNDTSTSDVGPHPLKATLTGFRLVKSSTVYLKCSVKVCDTTHCLLQPAGKRKRTKSSLKTASLKFEVIGTQSPRHANGGRDIHTAGKFSVITAMVIIVRYITCE